MNKLRVIDLLNKIANGEEVPLIKYRNRILHWNKEKDRFEDKNGMNTLYEMDFSELNDEVEIIEEKDIKMHIDDGYLIINASTKNDVEDKQIRKLDFIEENTFSKRQNGMTSEDRRLLDSNFKEIGNKINEIIDYLEEKE